MVLYSWELEADYQDEEYISGLKPVLFAEDPSAAESALGLYPTAMKKDLEGLQKQFFIQEELELSEATAVVKKPRTGDALYIWKQQNLDRLFEAPVASTTGKFILYTLFYTLQLVITK